MKAIFETYETLSGKFEYLMSNSSGCKGLPKQFKTELQAIEAGSTYTNQNNKKQFWQIIFFSKRYS
jgi:hypothetical protein